MTLPNEQSEIVVERLPETLPGHWDTPEGREKAIDSLRETREQLTKGDLSDFTLANAQYLAGRNDLDLIVWQTAAKERIRWLSAQLALARASAPTGEGQHWRHLKRGTVYEEIGRGELQASSDLLVDGSAMVVYRGEDGRIWVREEGEFEDGRFEPIALTTPVAQANGDRELAHSIAEVMAEDGGCWRACSGCQESNEGAVSTKDYPYSDLFKCQPGAGCHECGGIGVLWESGGFYDGYAEFAVEQERTRENVIAALEHLGVHDGKIFGQASVADEILALPASPALGREGDEEAWDDLKTHRRAWRNAITTARDFASEGCEDPDADRAYWNHELRAFDRTFKALLALTQPTQGADKALVEALEPFARAYEAVCQVDPDFPESGAVLRASFDWWSHDEQHGRAVKMADLRRLCELFHELESRAALSHAKDAG